MIERFHYPCTGNEICENLAGRAAFQINRLEKRWLNRVVGIDHDTIRTTPGDLSRAARNFDQLTATTTISAEAASSRVPARIMGPSLPTSSTREIRSATVRNHGFDASTGEGLRDCRTNRTRSNYADSHCKPLGIFAAIADQPPCLGGHAPSCCINEKRLATPQCSAILPSRTRMTSTVSNCI